MNKKCLKCGKEFYAYYFSKKFCSRKCYFTYQVHTPSWNKGLTKETDIRIKLLAEKISNTLKRNYRNGQRLPHHIKKQNSTQYIHRDCLPIKQDIIETPGQNVHQDIIKQEIAEYEKQEFRCIDLSKVIPDFIAIKDKKVYAVEIELHSPNYDKYNENKFYDDIIWIRYKKIKMEKK